MTNTIERSQTHATFVLERVTAVDENLFDPPPGAWRIARGATVVLHARGAPQ